MNDRKDSPPSEPRSDPPDSIVSRPPPETVPITPPKGGKPQFALVSSFWAGPLPDPQTLLQYDKVCPGAARLIINAFERQSKHRQDMEKQDMNIYRRNTGRGMIFAFVLGMSGITAGIIIGDLAGAGVVIGSIATLVGAYFWGKKGKSNGKTLENKENGNQLMLPLSRGAD